MSALEQHFAGLSYELEDETWVEIQVGDEWVDARTQFRSTTIQTFPGGTRLDVEAWMRFDGSETGWATVDTFWDGPWRLRRGYEILLDSNTGRSQDEA